MDATLSPSRLSGSIAAIASKSMAHRLLICAALCPGPTDVTCPTTSLDIEATERCLVALGARVTREGDVLHVTPIPGTGATDNVREARPGALLDCGESGSTLRFLLPVLCALGQGGAVTGAGRLAERPLSPLYERLVEGGCELGPQGSFPLSVSGRLSAGRFDLPGNVSSQYVSGLLMAAPLLAGPSEVRVTEPVESRPYVDLTLGALERFGIEVHETHEVEGGRSLTCFSISPTTPYRSCGAVNVEGDWSNAAFWLCAGALCEEGLTVRGLDLASRQGDRGVLRALEALGAEVTAEGDSVSVHAGSARGCELDVSDIPDLVPPLAVVASLGEGTTRITGAERLRLKESDRIESVVGGLSSLGARIHAEGDDIVIEGSTELCGGEVDAANDHRIAMMAAIAATRCAGAVTIRGAECVAKSYPQFFDDYRALGGDVTLEGTGTGAGVVA